MRIFISDNESDLNNENCQQESTPKFKIEIIKVFKERKSKWILCLIVCNSVVFCILCTWASSTNSLALRTYANTIVFNIFALVVCLVSIWVSQNSNSSHLKEVKIETKPIYNHTRSFSGSGYPQYKTNSASHFPRHSISDPCLPRDVRVHKVVPQVSSLSILGLEKYEVLALFVSSCLAIAAASFITIEAVTRIRDQPIIHTGRLGLGSLLGIVTHLITVYTHRDAGLDHVVCRALPCPTLKDYNPILGGNVLGAAILSGTHLFIHYWETYVADTAAAFALVGLVATSMLPLAFYTASIILQKLPHYMGEQLDKCIREALSIDGVLEFRNERFWTQSFGKLAGTIQVRIRKDANESHVLEGVMARLSRIVTTLTVQEFHETPKANFGSEHCTEYYINELLPNACENKTLTRIQRCEEINDIQTISIDDILGVEKEPVGIFFSNQFNDKLINKYSYDEIIGKFNNNNDNTMITICNQNKNQQFQVKNYLYNSQKNINENALIIGSNMNEAKFQNFTIEQG